MEKGGDVGLARINEGDNVGRRRCCGPEDRLAVAPPHGDAALGKSAKTAGTVTSITRIPKPQS